MNRPESILQVIKQAIFDDIWGDEFITSARIKYGIALRDNDVDCHSGLDISLEKDDSFITISSIGQQCIKIFCTCRDVKLHGVYHNKKWSISLCDSDFQLRIIEKVKEGLKHCFIKE